MPARGAHSFHEACQSFWFIQQLLQMESSGHSISPGRFDQYMYPYYQKDMAEGKITRDEAQELVDCIWVKPVSYTHLRGQTLFYIGYLIISTVQLGATIDYAILFSDRYWAFIAAFAFCLLMNILSAGIPAWRASRMNITDAINQR